MLVPVFFLFIGVTVYRRTRSISSNARSCGKPNKKDSLDVSFVWWHRDACPYTVSVKKTDARGNYPARLMRACATSFKSYPDFVSSLLLCSRTQATAERTRCGRPAGSVWWRGAAGCSKWGCNASIQYRGPWLLRELWQDISAGQVGECVHLKVWMPVRRTHRPPKLVSSFIRAFVSCFGQYCLTAITSPLSLATTNSKDPPPTPPAPVVRLPSILISPYTFLIWPD